MRGIAIVTTSRIRRRWAGLVWIGLLAALVGGMSTAALAGLRRSDSATERLVAETAAPDAYVFVNEPGAAAAERLAEVVADHEGVLATWPVARFIGRRADTKDWYFPLAGPARGPDIYRPVMEAGRMPADDAVGELAITSQTARNTGLDVGSRFAMDVYTADQMMAISDDSEVEPVGAHLELEVVGVMRDPADIAMNAVERIMVGSVALYDRYRDVAEPGSGIAVRMTAGSDGLDALVAALGDEFDPGVLRVVAQRDAVAAAQPSARVVRIGAILLAAVVAAVGLFAVAQTTRRQIGQSDDEDRTLSVIGFTRGDRVAATTLTGALSAVVAGVGAVVVAIALSPLFPIGRARIVEPAPGVDVDVALLVAGAATTALAVVAVFAAVAALEVRGERVRVPRAPSRAMELLSGYAPAPVFVGARLALQRTRRRDGASPRGAIVGTAVGVAGLVAAATFSASLQQMVSSPLQYGVDFDLSMEVPVSRIDERVDALAEDPEIDAVTTQWTGLIPVGDEVVDALSMDAVKGSIEPLVRSGRLPQGDDEAAVGPRLARHLGVELGDRIELSGEDPASTRSVTVVGTALDPRTISADHAGGLIVTEATLRAQAPHSLTPMLLVRYAAGVDTARKDAELDGRYPWGVMDESFATPPSELRSLADVGVVPRVLQWFFAGLALAALANGLLVAGRRNRRALGVVRGLGFTAAQVRVAMAAMAATMGAIAVAVGLPVGMVLGTWVWSQVADSVDLAPAVASPWLLLVLLLPVVLAAGAAISAWPAHAANAPAPAAILRTE